MGNGGSGVESRFAEFCNLGIVTDTRQPISRGALFVALDGPNHRGIDFVADAFQNGASVVVCHDVYQGRIPEGCEVIQVANSRVFLQDVARFNRARFDCPIVAITGSNGKTILKDFLNRLLNPAFHLLCSPGSYNSFVGVSKSLLLLNQAHELGVIEVGISKIGEMAEKASMIHPNFGILTNVGLAHLEGFGSREVIAQEKLKLFESIPPSGWVLLPDDPLVLSRVETLRCKVVIIGVSSGLPKLLKLRHLGEGYSMLRVDFGADQCRDIVVPVDGRLPEICETLFMGICAAHLLGLSPDVIVDSTKGFQIPQDRMEIWRSEFGHILINDTYSSDPVSVKSCLQVFKDYPVARKVLVFGGMPELGSQATYENQIVVEEALRLGVTLLLSVGELGMAVYDIFKTKAPSLAAYHFQSADDLLAEFGDYLKAGDIIVVKGPHKLRLDKLATQFKAHLSKTAYYIDLERLLHNVYSWRNHLKTNARLLVMIKALAYGSDALQMATFLQQHVDQLGVAYTKEAVHLRQHGIQSDILVQLALSEDLNEIVHFNLQPVVFDLPIVEELSAIATSLGKTVKVHLEVETGMGRFGVRKEDAVAAAQKIDALPGIELYGLMTHFSSAEDPEADAFTHQQIRAFQDIIEQLNLLQIRPPICHAAATAAAARFPQAHFDMVRIGLGIHGVYPSSAVAAAISLKCPLALVSKIASIQEHPKGQPISYNRRYITSKDSRIAYLPIGYHDGLARRWGGGWSVLIAGKAAPIVGAVCMDFTPIDVTDIPEAQVGSEVLIFGEWHGMQNPIESLAELEGTIPYEILCRLSERIQRIYLRDRF